MSVQTLAGSVSGFLGKHAGELRGITQVLGTIASELPIGAQDKDRITKVLGGLATAADNIEASAGKVANLPDAEIVVRETDVERAVAAVVPALVDAAVAKALAAKEAAHA